MPSIPMKSDVAIDTVPAVDAAGTLVNVDLSFRGTMALPAPENLNGVFFDQLRLTIATAAQKAIEEALAAASMSVTSVAVHSMTFSNESGL